MFAITIDNAIIVVFIIAGVVFVWYVVEEVIDYIETGRGEL